MGSSSSLDLTLVVIQWIALLVIFYEALQVNNAIHCFNMNGEAGGNGIVQQPGLDPGGDPAVGNQAVCARFAQFDLRVHSLNALEGAADDDCPIDLILVRQVSGQGDITP